MAASRKKRGISRDVMTRSGDPFVGGGEEMREEQWKYKRPGGDKSFSPSAFSPPGRIRKKRCSPPLGVEDYRISYRVDRFFHSLWGFEIALIHAYNILPGSY